ncbi:hypothetical protein KIN20_002515 [Parelaphostrongylus tenuis]|uniref:Uncharacterized protein n=1 Tax=Parelaphostrongylus tenuis TaxID=148309 RepID=A0AAD5MNP6_PARTN|nr:hypothetical protein KIN20_002515 [Parelaphostrongylus tenuis]
MAGLLTNLILILILSTISTVLGCGVIPAGQASNRTFTVTGFTTLPVSMVYTSAMNAARFSGIATSEAGARGTIQRLVMQTVFDVLEQQGRSALLPDAVISAILGQLNVEVSYIPLNCPLVTSPEEEHNQAMDKTYCIIVGSTVTGICTIKTNDQKSVICQGHNGDGNGYKRHTLDNLRNFSTTNVIMANWPRAMWQSVVDRAVRMLASDPFGSHFFSARAIVGGN